MVKINPKSHIEYIVCKILVLFNIQIQTRCVNSVTYDMKVNLCLFHAIIHTKFERT